MEDREGKREKEGKSVGETKQGKEERDGEGKGRGLKKVEARGVDVESEE